MSPLEHTRRRRLTLTVVAVSGVALAIGAALVRVQVTGCAAYRARARAQHERRIAVHPPRGLILDRLGRELAVSLETFSLFAHPKRLADPAGTARVLAPLLRMPVGELQDKLTSDKPFVYLKRFLEPEVARALRQLPLPIGDNEPLGFLVEPRRYYPRGPLAVHVVGYATVDGEGVEGIERQFDEELRGDPSIYLVLQDARGAARLSRLVRGGEKAPQDIYLTIDLVLQHLVERELDRAMKDSGAISASALLIDPLTGEVLALANRPHGDPNAYGRLRPEARVNRAVVHQYEPGSTFKIVPMASVLERQRVRPEQRFDCEAGRYRLGSRIIRDSKPQHWLTAAEILHKSSNIGMVKIVQRLQAEEFAGDIARFGFGRPTGIELPGERRGSFRPVAEWNGYSSVSLAFGHEIGVTTLQLTSALATIANEGVRIPPRIVLGSSREGRFLRATRPIAEPVIARHTARTLSAMLEGVVLDGTGVLAAVPGYRLAGKTGTAQKVIDGSYSETQYVASFGGWGPVSAPRLTCLVVLDSPRGWLHQGGHTAAPVFQRIMAEGLRYLRVPADEELPLLGEEQARQASTVRRKSGPKLEPIAPPPDGPGLVPDLAGLSLREAVSRLAARGYRARLKGSGVVAAQEPPAGSPLAQGDVCWLRFAERDADAASSDPARSAAPWR